MAVEFQIVVNMFSCFKLCVTGNTVIKMIIALVSCCLAIIVPLRVFSNQDAVFCIRTYGFWFISLIVLLCLIALIGVGRKAKGSCIRLFVSKNAWGLTTIFFAWVFVNVHIDAKFRVANDEYVLSTTAKSMYSDGKVYVPTVVHYYEGQVLSKAGIVGKRPLFFQYVLSLVHTISGFQPENVFWLNSFLAFILLVLIYCLMLCVGNRSMGILAVLLMASLPLFAENANGGGYEVMNLCLISMLCLSSIYYLKCPGSEGLNLMVFVSIALANCRYESILYVLVPAVLFLIKSKRENAISLTWPAILSPLLMIVPLMSYRVFQGYDGFFGTSKENFFSFAHLPNNVWHAIKYLFHLGGDYSNSLLISGLGVVSIVCLLFYLNKIKIFSLKNKLYLIAVFLVGIVVVINTLVALSCWWGAWTDPLTTRFSLPLHLFLVLMIPFAFKNLLNNKFIAACIFCFCILYIVTVTNYNNQRINDEPRFRLSSVTDLGLSWFLENVSQKENLIISAQCLAFGLFDYATMPPSVAVSFPERVMLMKDLGVYKNIYVFEIFDGSPKNKKLSRYRKELVFRGTLNDFVYFEISRITGLKPANEHSATLPKNLPPDKPENLDDPEYFIEYLRRICPLVPNMEVESFQKP